MKTEELNYFLPKKFIAQEPVRPRDSSRLLVLERKTETIKHAIFRNLPEYLNPGDTLIANNTRVFPARLKGYKAATRAKVEVFLLRSLSENRWEALIKPGRKVVPGTEVLFDLDPVGPDRENHFFAKISPREKLVGLAENRLEDGKWIFAFQVGDDLTELIKRIGHVPLPPYIQKPLADPRLYQTVYAKNMGSVAAPTAGLHFTPSLIKKLKDKGVEFTFITLNIGLDTFRPLSEDKLSDHHIHGEFFQIPSSSAKIINRALREGRRLVVVGTTSARALESAAFEGVPETQKPEIGVWNSRSKAENLQPGRRNPELATGDSERRIWQVKPKEGWTSLFIYPGYKFRIVNAMITNFHLPKSTTLAMAAAFGGKELIMKSYQEAMKKNYRFFSFGDAMLIL